ncbi:hypothetical protein [Alicyclobacillus acidiphilus]|uniref:hypothetical protein n=1 Tax=Alicyclobacillus acidiphilus TaxID=182455 RepID=UPI000831D4CB|nr:hypothetical protein [Alicyclobacillus acidiphilus]
MPLGDGISLDIGEFIQIAGERFAVIRNDELVGTVQGIRNSEDSPKRNYIGLYPNADVQDGDILRSEVSQELLFVEEASPEVVAGQLFQRKAFYLTERERKSESVKHSSSTTFNIHNSPGSIIGNQQTATLNYSTSVQDLMALIDQHETPDEEELRQLVEQIKAIMEGSEQAKGGILSRFSEVMQKNT